MRGAGGGGAQRNDQVHSGGASGAGCLLPLATPHAGAAALRPYHYPLHCGAVVASLDPEVRWRPGWSLNPLHCGAVVASAWRRGKEEEMVIKS